MIDLGTVKPGSTIRIPFSSFDKDDGSSITMTNYAAADILIYKDGSTTERASTAGFTATTDFDAKTGKHLAIIDLADNTTAGFFNAGSEYVVAIDAVTVDAVTTGGWIARFRIGYTGAILDTTIATLSTQTSFTLTAGPAEDDALNGMWCIIHDIASAVQLSWVLIDDYTGSTKTVTLAAGATFTAAAGDNISVMFPAPLQPTTIGRKLDVSTGGEAGLDWANVGTPGSTVSLSATTVATVTTTTTATNVTTVNGLAANVITATSIAADAITAAKIADGAIDAGAIASDAITAAKIATGAIDADALASDAGSEIASAVRTELTTELGRIDVAVSTRLIGSTTGSGLTAIPWNSAWDTEVESEATDALNAYDPPTRTEATADKNEIIAYLAGLVIAKGTIGATGNDTTHLHLTGLTYGDDEINNYLIAIKDVSTGEWHARYIEDWADTGDLVTVATLPFTPESSVDLYVILAFRQDVTGGAGLDAAGVRAAVGLASANLDTQLSGIQSDTNDIQTRIPATLGANGNIKADVRDYNGTAGTFSGGRPEVNTSHIGGSTTPVTNIGTVYNTDFAANYNTTLDQWNVNVESWNATAVPAEHTAGYPIVTVKDGTGTGEINTNAGAIALVDLVTTTTNLTTNNDKTGYRLSAAGVDDIWDEAQSGHATAGTFGLYLDAAITSRMATYTQPTGFLAATFPTTVASTTNITAGTITTVTNVTTVNGLAANVITAAAIADGAIDRAAFAADTGLQTTRSGTAQAGGASTITLDAGASSVTDFYRGQLFELTGGTGAGQAEICFSYNGTTKVATMYKAWVSIAPDNTTTFAIKGYYHGVNTSLQSIADLQSIGAVAGSNVTGLSSLGAAYGAGTLTTAIVGNITGNLSGSVGSVTGAVGSVTGAVGSVTGNVGGNVVGSVASVTGNVGGNVTGTIGGFTSGAKAEINAEVVDCLATDTYAEPGQGTPSATLSLASKLGYVFKAWRNKTTQTATEYKLFADDTTTVDQKSTVSDDATTFTKGEIATGP